MKVLSVNRKYVLFAFCNIILDVFLILINGFNYGSIMKCACLSILILISDADLKTYEIPPYYNIAIFLLGVINLIYDRENYLTYIIGFMCVSGFLLLVYAFTRGQGIGGGDIKLMASAGLLLGYKNIILAFVIGCILGSVIHLTLMYVKKKENMLAFGPYLAAGIIVAMIYGKQLITIYFSMLY